MSAVIAIVLLAGARPPAPFDPEPLAALARMGAFLREQTALTLTCTASTDEVLDTGQKIQLGSRTVVHVRWPDRLRADVASDRNTRQYFYDGRSVTVAGPRGTFYATAPAPRTIVELLDVASSAYDLELPVARLFYWGTSRSRVERLTSAIDLGPTTIDDTVCDHYAFREPGRDWQIWIARGPRPLPRKLVLTATTAPGQPQHTLELRWNLEPELDDALFTFVPPPDSRRVQALTQ